MKQYYFWRYYILFVVDTILQNLFFFFPSDADPNFIWDKVFLPCFYARVAVLFFFMSFFARPSVCASAGLFIHGIFCSWDIYDQFVNGNTGTFFFELLVYFTLQGGIIYLHLRYHDRPQSEWRRWISDFMRT